MKKQKNFSKIALATLTLFTSFSVFAKSEINESALNDAVSSSYANMDFFKNDSLNIGYTRFGNSSTSSAKGCIVISPGRTEASIKYLELAQDLEQKGYGPIFAIDHRGQGFSDRELSDTEKGHIWKFSSYVEDFQKFVDTIVKKDSLCQNASLFLIAHSMGGGIAASYLETVGNKSPFKKAVLSAPMLKIDLGGLSEAEVLEKTKWCAFATGISVLPITHQCIDYIPGGKGFDDSYSCNDAKHTSSKERCEFGRMISRKFPETQLGSATVYWTRQSILADIELRKKENIAKIATPILMFQAGLEKYVDNIGQDEFCDAAEATGKCKLSKEAFKNAKHEILMEVDEVRTTAIKQIIEFLQ